MIGTCDGSPTSTSGCSRTSSDPRPRVEGLAPSRSSVTTQPIIATYQDGCVRQIDPGYAVQAAPADETWSESPAVCSLHSLSRLTPIIVRLCTGRSQLRGALRLDGYDAATTKRPTAADSALHPLRDPAARRRLVAGHHGGGRRRALCRQVPWRGTGTEGAGRRADCRRGRSSARTAGARYGARRSRSRARYGGARPRDPGAAGT